MESNAYIGSIEIPDEVPIPEASITMETRQGVELTYVPEFVS